MTLQKHVQLQGKGCPVTFKNWKMRQDCTYQYARFFFFFFLIERCAYHWFFLPNLWGIRCPSIAGSGGRGILHHRGMESTIVHTSSSDVDGLIPQLFISLEHKHLSYPTRLLLTSWKAASRPRARALDPCRKPSKYSKPSRKMSGWSVPQAGSLINT